MAEPIPSFLPGSIPIPRTRLIGRETERATALTWLLDQVAPLLTLTGPGGSEKTRLALAVAHFRYWPRVPAADPDAITIWPPTGCGVTRRDSRTSI
jgi:hypothetical protein